jgi:tetratricopeptide (TPR) repeat protein
MTEYESKFNKAEEYLDNKKYLQALQIFQSLQDVPQFKRKSIIKLIEIYDAQNQVDSAVKLFENYLSDEPDDENIRTFYAQFLIRHKKYGDAHDVLSGVSIKSHPEKNFLMGMVNYYLNDYEISLINFEEFIKRNKNSELLPEAHLYSAKCHLKTHELDLALKELKKSEALSIYNYEVYQNFAIVYYLKEMYFHALESIRKSMELNPVEVSNYELSGKIYFKMGEYQKARKELETTSEMKELDSEAYALLGIACLKLKDNNNARKYFEQALKKNPANEIALKELENCN